MTMTIAIGGKGGTGKTVIASLVVESLSQRGIVLAIDGDPSTNLNQALGLPLTGTVGGAREEMTKSIKRGDFDVGIPKPDYLDLRIKEATVRGITTASQMKKLVAELQNQVRKIYFVLNRLPGELPPQLKKLIDESGLELITTISEDPYLADLEIEGKPFRELPSNSPLKISVREIVDKIEELA